MTREVATPFGTFACFEGDLITSQLERFGGHQRSDLAMARACVKPGDMVVDIGAHIGTFAIPLGRAVSPGGRVVAFEPVAAHFDLLRRNVARNGLEDVVEPVEALAGDRPGSGRIESKAANTGASHVGQTGPSIRQTTVDAWWSDHGRPQIHLLKVDVEGMELKAIRGAERLITEHRPRLVVEVCRGQLRAAGDSVWALDRFLRRSGYRYYVNLAERNSGSDEFVLGNIPSLLMLLQRPMLFDVLAVHKSDPGHPRALSVVQAAAGLVKRQWRALR